MTALTISFPCPFRPFCSTAFSIACCEVRACIACHTLGPEDGNRAGPTLHGIFGRKIAALADYPYSPAFRRMDIVWTPETVSKLFELGPSIYTPGTKMPNQTINDPEDRAALIRFLQSETRRD